MIPGLTTKITSAGIPVVRVHYSADEHKRPGTPAGDQWMAQALSGYPGGVKSPRWKKEMEIDYGAMGGTKLFPEWEQWSNNGRIVIPPFDPQGYRLYASYDHGWRNPLSYHVHGVNGDGYIVTLYEIYGSHIPYKLAARAIKGETVTVFPSGCCESHDTARVIRGNPFFGRETWKRADPSMWAKDQPQSDNTNKSMADLYAKEGVYFQQAERGTDTTVAEWLLSHYWRDPMNPLYRITTDCPKLIWELGQQRHKQISAQVALNRDQPEELVDKDNHAWDDMKYFMQKFPPKPEKQALPKAPGSFEWWKKTAKQASRGEVLGTYRIQT